ncbi:MAG: peptidase S1, partial [Chloroflexi bacterium]
MRAKRISVLPAILGLILFSFACALLTPDNPPAAEPTQAPTATPSEKGEVTAQPVHTSTAPPVSGAATNLEEAEKAVIRIVAEGSYEYPDFTTAQELGSGSGFIISPDGIAVTNNHVVTGAARIKVFFSDNQKAYNARVLGVSECSDLAVIQIDGQDFPYLEWYPGELELGL